MEIVSLYNAAKIISCRNVNEHVVSVGVIWNSLISKLTIKYYLNHEPDDDDIELCELSLTELLSEFSDIALAETACILINDGAVESGPGEKIVYASEKNGGRFI